MDTPWGKADLITEYMPGLEFASTPSHGGFILDSVTNAEVPVYFKDLSFGGQGHQGFYEEDQDWCFVVLTFPHLFTDDDTLEAACTTFTRFLKWTEKKGAKTR
jgi:hypothetical protein